jgi:hypothetical protein
MPYHHTDYGKTTNGLYMALSELTLEMQQGRLLDEVYYFKWVIFGSECCTQLTN